jgi:sortase A
VRVPVVHHRIRRRRARRRRILWSGGELLVTAGVLGLLLVAHQLWWTNREAREGAERRVEALEREWRDGSGYGGQAAPGSGSARGSDSGSGSESAVGPGADSGSERGSGTGRRSGTTTPPPSLSQAYAILTIPRLGLRAPVAEGTSKRNVLNKGYVGHYAGTQQPGQNGNFALAGHRNTHGEPFRYLNQLRKGDEIEVTTRTAVHTYAVDAVLSRTSPRDSGVLRPVPRSLVHPSRGYDAPGRYLTLTTCTPEYSSRYRLVVWGKLMSTRARS